MRAFRLAYDGRPFHGFQRQPDVPTVEGALFEALAGLDVTNADANSDANANADVDADVDTAPAGYSAAGRTDAGVSAVAQTVAFECPDWCSPRALNSELPPTVRAFAAADATTTFHATHDARSRSYTYHLHAPSVDDERVRRAAARLAGEHDFHNLALVDTGTVRDISIDAVRDEAFLTVTVAAGGFPRGLVRRLVSLLEAVGTGEAPLGKVDRVLSSEPLEGPDGVSLAPAAPLVLSAVEYDLAFESDPDAAADARDRFAERRVRHAANERVAGSIVDGIGPADS